MLLCTLAAMVGPHAVYTGVTYIRMDRVAPRFSAPVWLDRLNPSIPHRLLSLSRSNPRQSASKATATDDGDDYCSRRRRPRLPRAPASTATTAAPSPPHLLSGADSAPRSVAPRRVTSVPGLMTPTPRVKDEFKCLKVLNVNFIKKKA